MSEGLSHQEASLRLKQYGYNELSLSGQHTAWRTLKEVMSEPMFLLLLACGLLYVLIGDYREGIILMVAFSFIMVITYWQAQKTRRTLDALRALSAPRVLVRRGGEACRIAAREVVPGDLMLLSEGDRISADAVLISALGLMVDESILTGESVPVYRSTKQGENRVYSGTLVVKGSAEAEVLNTAGRSEVGGIALSLAGIATTDTPMQKELKILTRKLAWIGLGISVSVVVIFYITRHNWVQAVLTGLSSAMAIMPEEFPVVLTVFMALGAWRLSSKQVLTRKPSAIETLGSATVLCTDKTGTLTQNRMSLVQLSDGDQIYPLGESSLPENARQILKAAALCSRARTADPIDNAVILEWKARQGAFVHPGHPIWEISPDNENRLMAAAYHIHGSGITEVYCKGAPETVLALCGLDNNEPIKEHLRQQAEETARIAAAAYREGGTDLLRLLDAQRLQLETQLVYVQALVDYRLAVANLETAMGANQ